MTRTLKTKPARTEAAVSLPALSHELKIELKVLEGLWHRGVVSPIAAGPAGLMFPRAKLMQWLRFSGEIV